MHGLGPVFRDIIDSDVTINFQERHLPVHLVNNQETVISQMFYNTNEMIKNVCGSHLIYAAASGVKVKAIDEIFELRDERLKNKLWLKEISLYPKKYQEKFKRHFASFRGTDKLVAIWNSKDTKGVEEYANNLLGTKYRKDQKIIREFLTPKSKIDEISFASNLLFNKIRQKIEKNFYKLTCSKIL